MIDWFFTFVIFLKVEYEWGEEIKLYLWENSGLLAINKKNINNSKSDLLD